MATRVAYPGYSEASRGNSYPWKAILPGSLANEAHALLERIPSQITDYDEQWLFGPERSYPYSLAYGHAGKSLFLLYLSLATGSDAHKRLAERFLDQACITIKSDIPSYGLFRGPAGLRWLLNHCDNRREIFQIDVTGAIKGQMAELKAPVESEQDELGLFYGIAGDLLAMAEEVECDSPQSKSLIRDINARCDRAPGGCAWRINGEYKDRMRRKHRGISDDMLLTTVASGTAGILGPLAALLSASPHNAPCRELAHSAARWLSSTAIPSGLATQRVFPILVRGKTPRLDAFGWASGDLGIVVSLYIAAKVLQDSLLEERAVSLARKICDPACLSAQVPRCTEYNLVSGTAGRAHLCNRLYQYTGEDIFLNVALEWYKHTLKLCSQPPDVGSPVATPPCLGLMLGSAGLGLALLAAVSEIEPCWDRLMLASTRTAGV